MEAPQPLSLHLPADVSGAFASWQRMQEQAPRQHPVSAQRTMMDQARWTRSPVLRSGSSSGSSGISHGQIGAMRCHPLRTKLKLRPSPPLPPPLTTSPCSLPVQFGPPLTTDSNLLSRADSRELQYAEPTHPRAHIFTDTSTLCYAPPSPKPTNSTPKPPSPQSSLVIPTSLRSLHPFTAATQSGAH